MAGFRRGQVSKIKDTDLNKMLVFDTETTGLSPSVDEILQITILDGNGTVLFNSYIQPKHRKRWPAAQRINHISPEMVRDAPKFSDVSPEIQNIFNHAKIIVGYNVSFDLNFVRPAGIVVSGKIIDVMTEFSRYRYALGERYKRYKLKECADYFGFGYTAHNSFDDARVTLQCFHALENARCSFNSDMRPKSTQCHLEDGWFHGIRNLFSIQFKTRRRRNLAIRGIILFALGQLGLFCSTSYFCSDLKSYTILLNRAFNEFPANWFSHISSILIGLGCVLICIGAIKWIIRLPRVLLNKMKHFINRFK